MPHVAQSKSELVDIVDTNGAVLGTIEKIEAHKAGVLHKCVIGDVKDSQGRWLLVKQANDRQDAGQYVCPVGEHVRSGESDDDALKREAGEEMGLMEDFKYEQLGRGVFERHVIGRHENHLFIQYVIHSDVKPKLNHENVDYEYFNDEELRRQLKENPGKFGDSFHFTRKTFHPDLLT